MIHAPAWATQARTAAALGIAIMVAGLIGMGPALSHLGRARAMRDALHVLAARPVGAPPRLMPAGAMLQAAGPRQAQAALHRFVREAAVRQGVLIETLAEDSPPAPAAGVAFGLSGDSAHVLRFAESLENRTPLIRFAKWRIETTGPAGSIVRLRGTAVVIWGRRV